MYCNSVIEKMKTFADKNVEVYTKASSIYITLNEEKKLSACKIHSLDNEFKSTRLRKLPKANHYI